MEVRPERYDSPVGAALVSALLADLNLRYGDEDDGGAGWLAEVEPHHVAPPHGIFLVSWRDDEPVGCGALKRLDGTTAEVKRMYTAPAARRQGIGRAVLRGLVDSARALGYERILLEAGTEQPEALALYSAEGFTRTSGYGRYRDDPRSRCYELVL